MDFNGLPDSVKDKITKMLANQDDSKSMIVEEQNGFMDEFITKNDIKIGYDGRITWRQQPGICKKILITKAYESYKVWAVDRKLTSVDRISKGDIAAQFDVYVHQQRVDILFKLHASVCYHPKWDDGLKELKKFVKALLPESDEKHLHFCTKVFESFIWQTKRKISGKKVFNHVMPVLFSSKHGTGKSTSVERLTSPLAEFRLDMQLHIFSDPFMRKAFGENFIVCFDEMQGAEKADVEAMKNAITAGTLSARGMRTQDVDTIPQNCTFIGTSNRRVGDMIFDSTGMRRFVEIELPGMFDRDAILNDIDYTQIWRSVKEDDRNPISDIEDEIGLHQEDLRTKSTYEQWMDYYGVKGGSVEMPIQAIYNHYKSWLKDQGKSPGMLNRFAREIAILGIKNTGRKTIKGVKQSMYSLNINLGTGEME